MSLFRWAFGVALALAPMAAQAQTHVAAQASAEAATVRMTPDGSVALAGQSVLEEALIEGLQQLRAGGYEGPIYVRAFAGVEYVDVLSVIDLIQQGGFNRIMLQSEVGEDGVTLETGAQ